MNTRWLLNLTLLLAVAALILLTIYEPGIEPQPVSRLTQLNAKDIHIIQLQSPEAGNILMHQEQDRWIMTEPLKVPVNPVRIDALTDMVSTLSHSHFSAAGKPLEKYGLAPDKGSIRFNDIQILFGAVEPVNKRRYVKLGNEIHLVNDTYYHNLITDAYSFADTRLLPKTARIRKLVLPGLTLEKNPDGKWHGTPDNTLLSADQVNQLIDEWRLARAVYVKKASDLPTISTIQLTMDDDSVVQFDLVDHKDAVILRRNDLGIQYHMTDLAREQLLSLPKLSDSPRT